MSVSACKFVWVFGQWSEHIGANVPSCKYNVVQLYKIVNKHNFNLQGCKFYVVTIYCVNSANYYIYFSITDLANISNTKSNFTFAALETCF